MHNTIRQANLHDLDLLVPLFDAYRQFYAQASDPERARSFLADRMERKESVIFIAVSGKGTGLGFVQLYPSFSSVRTTHTFILNDLFVSENARRMGIAKQLLEQTSIFARENGATNLSLSTALTNSAAQKLYESLGWKRNDTFYVYHFSL